MSMEGKRNIFYYMVGIGFLSGILAFYLGIKLIEFICWVNGMAGIKI